MPVSLPRISLEGCLLSTDIRLWSVRRLCRAIQAVPVSVSIRNLPTPYIGSVNSVSACPTDQMPGTKLYLIYRASEYSYLFRDAKNSTAYSTLRSGPWMVEVKDHIESRIAGSSVKYRHNIAHDGSMAALLGFLQIDQMVWPGKHILER